MNFGSAIRQMVSILTMYVTARVQVSDRSPRILTNLSCFFYFHQGKCCDNTFK